MSASYAVKSQSKRALFILLTALASAWAQGSAGSITGVVKDTSGGVVPGVSVIVTNETTGSGVTVHSRADGIYVAPNLIPGDYTVSAHAPGFKHVEVRTLKVDVGTTVTENITLEVGIVTESVQAAAEANLVDTVSGQLGHMVTIKHVLEMPLVDRNVFTLVSLVPSAFERG